ncbi:MAG: hypothetical protein IJ875_04005 [Solobacterium sp.]|nr:hypothetical protein [Solobacterium sp.]
MEEFNRIISDDELKDIVGGTREECLELMQWCNDHGSEHISLPPGGQRLDPAELWKAYNFVLNKLHSINYLGKSLKMPNDWDNQYTLYDQRQGKRISLTHREFMDFLNENFG